MKHKTAFLLAAFVAVLGTAYVSAETPLPTPTVLTESEVFILTPPDNGSGPLWSFGCTQVARLGDNVFVSAMETGIDAPLLCNTRWRLLKLEGSAWRQIAQDEPFRQREPCPLAVLPPNRLILNANDSVEPPGTKYGRCTPLLHMFVFGPDATERQVLTPQWAGAPHFTDHSYRGYAADPVRERLLMLNIDATTGVQNACLVSSVGETLATGSVTFPVRSCYPQVALNDFAVHILAIGDIVEPVEAWRKYKFEQTQREWDYVFRRLFYTRTPDLRSAPFSEPLEIDSADETAGAIMNQDLWVAPDGEAWILYTRCEVQNALMRDKFFPDKSILPSLRLARVRDNSVTARSVLLPEDANASISHARFHVTPEGHLFAVLHMTGKDPGVKLMRLLPEDPAHTLIPVPLSHPLSSYCLANVRAGNAPSNLIDFFGTEGGNVYRYAAVRLDPGP